MITCIYTHQLPAAIASPPENSTKLHAYDNRIIASVSPATASTLIAPASCRAPVLARLSPPTSRARFESVLGRVGGTQQGIKTWSGKPGRGNAQPPEQHKLGWVCVRAADQAPSTSGPTCTPTLSKRVAIYVSPQFQIALSTYAASPCAMFKSHQGPSGPACQIHMLLPTQAGSIRPHTYDVT